MTIGILAYGSLVEDPGEELEAAMVRRIDNVDTPFAIEFARCSKTRGGAPTLVPVKTGGAPVVGTILVLDDSVDESSARDMLYRRETHHVGDPISRSDVGWIASEQNFFGVDTCLYTALPQNIDSPSAGRLAELAIASARGAVGAEHLDGISYLIEQKGRGLMTPLMPSYYAEILSRAGAEDLRSAWDSARASTTAGDGL